jgi:Flp pilus assembly pilin Flp
MNLHRRRASEQGRKPRLESLRRLRQERGQTLVEYALIIAVVSLGALAALGFLTGRIQNLFSKTGNSLEAVSIGGSSSGSGSGSGSATSGSPTPPANNAAPTAGNNPGIVTSGIPGGSGVVFSTGIQSSGIDPGQGVLSNTQPSSAGCTISYSNGNTYTFTGVWAPDPPDGNNNSPIWQSGGSGTTYHWACVGSGNFSTPANNTSYGAYKEFDDDRVDNGTYVYFTNIPWHGSGTPGNSGVFRNGGSTGSGQAFFYTNTGIYVCTWQTNPGGSNNHWATNTTHGVGETTNYSQRCA